MTVSDTTYKSMNDGQLAAWLQREAPNHDAHGQFVMRKAAQAIIRLRATADLLARHDKALPLSIDHDEER